MMINVLMALSLGVATAASDEDTDTATEAEVDAPTVEVDFSIVEAETLEDLRRRRVRWLKPRRVRLPQNPNAHTDFTAYTLEWGEVELGFMGMRAGLLPGVQVGSSPLLNVAGVYNGQLKISAIHTGPLDVSGVVTHYRHDGGLTARMTSGGLTASVQLTEPWSLHATGSYLSGTIQGLPEVGDTISSTVLGLTGWDIDAYREEVLAQGVALDAEAEVLTLKVATDIRFNRRDSLIIQGQAALWGRVEADVGELELPEELGLDAALSASHAGAIPLSEAYMATASWQWSWKRAYLRVGGGVSSVQGAWLMQSTEFAWRFGGETRRSERHLRQSWRSNRRGLRKGADSAIVSAGGPDLASTEETAER
jgi:hypothetical protein